MSDETKLDRSHLPIRNTQRPGFVTYDAKDPETKFPPIRDLRPPDGAPNVLIVLIDDAGFGSSSAFGGPCQSRMPRGWRRLASSTPASTPRRSAHPRVRRC